MENKPSKSVQVSQANQSIITKLLFLFINVLLMSVLSWVLLIAWFSVQIILSDIQTVKFLVHNIVNQQYTLCSNYHLNSIETIVNTIDRICNETPIWLSKNITSILMDSTRIIFLRIGAFVAFFPVMSLIFLVLAIDGLVQRDIRKFQGARESSLVFHRLRPLARFSFLFIFFIYMVIPIAISPELFLIPMSLVSSIFITLSIRYFKKYL